MLASLLVVFREVIEAGLIVGIVLAASKGVSGRGLVVGIGVAAGVLGACVVAALAGEIESLFEGAGQELFNAAVLAFAVAMLAWHNVWMSGHGRQIARDMRAMGAKVASGERALAALGVVVGLAVLREGSEVVLFLYGVASQSGATSAGLVAGGALGLGAGAAISALMYYGLLAIPAHKLFSVTSGLITLLAAGMAAQAVLYLQQAGYFEVLTRTLWDTSWLLPEGGPGVLGVIGQMLHTLVGYSDAPNGAQLAAYLATIFAIVGLMRWERSRREVRPPVPAAAE
ncbi:MAG TPA: FTR1 family protein [Rhizomicrobium sp.]|jgi:high-affinity iron transporter|nr:FTR1 family protein [Rhizomicrobium sp.]